MRHNPFMLLRTKVQGHGKGTAWVLALGIILQKLGNMYFDRLELLWQSINSLVTRQPAPVKWVFVIHNQLKSFVSGQKYDMHQETTQLIVASQTIPWNAFKAISIFYVLKITYLIDLLNIVKAFLYKNSQFKITPSILRGWTRLNCGSAFWCAVCSSGVTLPQLLTSSNKFCLLLPTLTKLWLNFSNGLTKVVHWWHKLTIYFCRAVLVS